MAVMAGLPLTTGWLALTFVLYGLVGVCWLPVVWLQIKLRAIARGCLIAGTPLPERYFRYLRYWFALGWPAFAGVLAIFYLMIYQPGDRLVQAPGPKSHDHAARSQANH